MAASLSKTPEFFTLGKSYQPAEDMMSYFVVSTQGAIWVSSLNIQFLEISFFSVACLSVFRPNDFNHTSKGRYKL